MAEYLAMNDQVIRQRVENAMQQWEWHAERQIEQFHLRLDTMLTQDQAHIHDLREHDHESLLQEDWNYPGRYFGMRQDSEIGPEMYSAEAARIFDLHARLDAMGQAQQHAPQHAQGMEP